MMKLARLIPVLLIALFTSPAMAASDHGSPHMMDAAGKAAPSEGTVKRLDAAQNTITIAHGPLANLGMPAMTMTFRVASGENIAQIKPGQKIRFVAGSEGSALTASKIEAVR